MIFYDYYADVPEETLREFVSKQELGHFVTVSAEGQPHIGLYPFLFLARHHRDAPASRGRAAQRSAHQQECTFEVDEMHGTIPSHWIHPTNAMFATAYHRTVIFECEAEVSEDHEVLAAQQRRLMAHYQPDWPHAGDHRARDVSRPVQARSPRSRCTCARAR